MQPVLHNVFFLILCLKLIFLYFRIVLMLKIIFNIYIILMHFKIKNILENNCCHTPEQAILHRIGYKTL